MTQTDQPAQPAKESHASFFRQSGWMLFATTLGGFFFWAVHVCARPGGLPPNEYSVVLTLLQVLNQMAIPTMGLQTIFIQEAALAETEQHRQELAGAVRSVLKATFLIWLAFAAVIFFLQGKILKDYKIINPAALWTTVGLGLTSLWLPITNGIMLGRQNFLWAGLSSILISFTRLLLALTFVFVLGWYAAGTMLAVLLATLFGLGIGVWQTYPLWTGRAIRFDWTPWLKRVVLLTLGTGSVTLMFTFDMLAVQRFLPDSNIYGAAGMVARAIMFLVAPMVAVMFPKIVRSAAKAQHTDVMAQTLGITVLVAMSAALFATFFAKIPILVVQGSDYLPAAKLIPWFTWCILPMTVSSVLVNNLMARQQYKVVPWLVVVVLGYVIALWRPGCHASHLDVIRTMGVFAFLYFVICIWFTWGAKGRRPELQPA